MTSASVAPNEGVEKVLEGSKGVLCGGPRTPPSGMIVQYASFYEVIFRVEWEETAKGTFSTPSTFDMSGGRKPAKLAGGRPLDGGVRAQGAGSLAARGRSTAA